MLTLEEMLIRELDTWQAKELIRPVSVRCFQCESIIENAMCPLTGNQSKRFVFICESCKGEEK